MLIKYDKLIAPTAGTRFVKLRDAQAVALQLYVGKRMAGPIWPSSFPQVLARRSSPFDSRLLAQLKCAAILSSATEIRDEAGLGSVGDQPAVAIEHLSFRAGYALAGVEQRSFAAQ